MDMKLSHIVLAGAGILLLSRLAGSSTANSSNPNTPAPNTSFIDQIVSMVSLPKTEEEVAQETYEHYAQTLSKERNIYSTLSDDRNEIQRGISALQLLIRGQVETGKGFTPTVVVWREKLDALQNAYSLLMQPYYALKEERQGLYEQYYPLWHEYGLK